MAKENEKIVENKIEKETKEKEDYSKLSIYEKMQRCRVELQEMNLKKSGENKFAGFKYYELADILPVINKLFLKYNLHSSFNIIDNVAKLCIVNIDRIEEYITYESPIAEANIKGCTPVQSLGGIHTYLKRYLYMNALEIVENDLFDGKTGDMEVEKAKPMTAQQKELLNSLTIEDKKNIIAKYGTTDLTFKQASEVLKEFK